MYTKTKKDDVSLWGYKFSMVLWSQLIRFSWINRIVRSNTEKKSQGVKMQFFAIYYRNESSKCTVLPEVHHVNESSILENSSIYSEREKNCSFYDNTTDSHRAPKRSVNRSNYPALCCSSILVPIVVGRGWRIGYSKPGFWKRHGEMGFR